MCSAPKIEAPAVQRIGSSASDAAVREGELERRLRRTRSGSAADILTSPLGLVGDAMGGA
ncbi:hypothetical protein [Oceaniglobus trochenteri]|uniref:hypothetical protein n=1 Tax=Oceaniglobus trochenteri TaxID=2763260 RepID=UPI001CFFA27A|nr:hypothetical protein [Oceaniglobus trochenteri]